MSSAKSPAPSLHGSAFSAESKADQQKTKKDKMIQITHLPLLGSWDSAEPETAAHSEPSPGLKLRILIMKTRKTNAAGCTEVALHFRCDVQ